MAFSQIKYSHGGKSYLRLETTLTDGGSQYNNIITYNNKLWTPKSGCTGGTPNSYYTYSLQSLGIGKNKLIPNGSDETPTDKIISIFSCPVWNQSNTIYETEYAIGCNQSITNDSWILKFEGYDNNLFPCGDSPYLLFSLFALHNDSSTDLIVNFGDWITNTKTQYTDSANVTYDFLSTDKLQLKVYGSYKVYVPPP